MSRRVQENLVAGLLLFLFIAVIVASMDYSPRARMVPIPIAVLGALLVIVQIIQQNLQSDGDLRIDVLEFLTSRSSGPDAPNASSSGEPGVEADQSTNKGEPKLVDELGALGVVIALVVAFLLIGPIPSMLLFSAGYFILSRHYTPGKGLAYALFYTALVYLVFGYGLKVQLDGGLIDPSLGLL